ncbi:hypothetical protein HG536_0F02470 [Torulaspora globosa]|uniref:Uncharacterized protein n=1 Tax=Torulaspora globosa TaxID=48254 RepID=A0A7G3ZK86_9SACH|nr:uncharacterized protein HG536_0F02470 [Torulaspora globosa]QLL33922.1 hypothetical protein HG536_0F02470 [Torulaspora globosa]
MSATHLNTTKNHRSYAQSTDFLNLEEPPAAKESPSGSQFCLADFNDANDKICAGDSSYTRNYEQDLRQARLLNEDDTVARPPIGEPVRRRSTNYVDALREKARSQARKQDRAPSQDQPPVFKPSYTTGKQEIPSEAQEEYNERTEGSIPQLEHRKSSFEYEDFKKDVYDRLNMFDKE